MSSFFTIPASQKKRKRAKTSDGVSEKRSAPSKARRVRDESISGSDDSDDDVLSGRNPDPDFSDDEDEDFEDEDPAAKRVRLAEQYLANTQREVLADVGFDAAEIDQENLRRRMGDRLKDDTAESKGKLYRWIANEFDWTHARQTVSRLDCKSMTGVAVHEQHAYVVAKDMSLSKWELPPSRGATQQADGRASARTKPRRVGYTRGDRKLKTDRDSQHHHAPILCVAVSSDGKFVATGGADNKMIVWDSSSLKSLKVFTQHRDSVTSLAFRRGTNQLFSASKDRTVKIWSLDELAYVETLFGHQDEVVDVDALTQEKCVTVGARDRTARLWKVVEESQLVFRGGGAPARTKDRQTNGDVGVAEMASYHEGSMDRVVCIDDETFVTGSDNGTLSLWNVHKKKPVASYPLAHGLDPPPPVEEVTAEAHPEEDSLFREAQPRWITSLRAIPFSNVFVTGSWDGCVRAWRISDDKRRIDALGPLGMGDGKHIQFDEDEEKLDGHAVTADQPTRRIEGFVNDLTILERGDKGKEGIVVLAAIGQEPRCGRYKVIGTAKNCVVTYELRRAEAQKNGLVVAGPEGEGDFEGFD